MVTLAQDSFTEAGTGTAGLGTHTAETGGTWVGFWQESTASLLIDKDNDRFKTSTGFGEVVNRLGSGVLGDGDLYLSCPAGQNNWAGPVARMTGTSCYWVEWSDTDSDGTYFVLTRLTSGVITSLVYVNTLRVQDLYHQDVRMRLQVSGSSPTTLKARVWHATDAEPGTWDIDTTENTAANQVASGGFGVSAYRSSGYGVYGTGDDFLVTDNTVAINVPGATMAMRGLV